MKNQTIPYAQEILLFLFIAALIVPFFNRLKINPVLGFLLVGIIIGPFGLIQFYDTWPVLQYVTISDVKSVRVLAELGVVFLLFSIGLELSSSRLWAMRRLVFGLGSLQIILSGLIIAFIASLWGHSPEISMLIGGSLALSSTAVIIKLLVDSNKLASPIGQKGFSILLMQDLAIVPILFLVTLMAAEPGASPVVSLFMALGRAGLAVIIILLFGRYLLRPLFHFVSVTKNRDMFMATILLVILGTGILGAMAGMGMAVGAFLAGVMLAETEYSHQVEIDIEPFRGLFLGLFFLSVGMQLNLPLVYNQLGWIAISVVGLLSIKTAVIIGCGLLFRIPWQQSLLVGFMLSGAGEFAFVIIEASLLAGLIPQETAQFIMILATVTIFLTPIIYEIVQYLSKKNMNPKAFVAKEAYAQKDSLQNHIIIAGFGRVGETIARVSRINQLDYIGLDNNGHLCQAMKEKGYRVFFGDASQWHILKKINAHKAKTIVLTMDESKAVRRAVEAIMKFNPEAVIVARAKNSADVKALREMGVEHVIHETVEMSLQMSSKLLSVVGLSSDSILTLLERARQEEYNRK